MTDHFDGSTPEETVAAWVTSGAPGEALLALLPEEHPLYAGRSTNETARIRGFILAAFEKTGLPEGALPYVLEELESGRHPYLVAAAARALRATRPDPAFTGYLQKAQRNIAGLDTPVTFDVYKPRWPMPNATSAMEEIRKTLDWIGTPGDCCGVTFPPSRTPRTADPRIELEDQDGRTIRFGEFFTERVSVVAFFYTRCDNPDKCSLTVARLARLQEAVERGPLHGQVRIAAITYDPHYDLPRRMKLFGENRGIHFNDGVRFFRTPDGFDRLRGSLELGVNFSGSMVNRHRIELYVLNAKGEAVATFTRMQWDVDTVVAELQAQLSPPPPPPPPPLWSMLPAILFALLPKCPLCLGAYLTAIGLGGMQALLPSRWTIPLSIVLLLLHVWMVGRRFRQTRALTPLALTLAGAAALLGGGVLWNVQPVAVGGAVLLLAASVIGAMLRGGAWERATGFGPATRSLGTSRNGMHQPYVFNR